MDEHPTLISEEPVELGEEPNRALVLRPEAALVAEPVTPAPSRLPAIIGQRLPALWDGGRGPLARAVVAGGLLALGSVVGRMAANPPSALVPSGKAAAAVHAAAPDPRRDHGRDRDRRTDDAPLGAFHDALGSPPDADRPGVAAGVGPRLGERRQGISGTRSIWTA